MDVFTAIADPVRRALLRSLRSGPARAGDLAAGQPISRPAVSKHLRALTQAGLVQPTVRGRERHYELTTDGLGPVADLVAELSSGSTAELGRGLPLSEALDALETEVRRASRDRRAAAQSAERRAEHLPTERTEHEETA